MAVRRQNRLLPVVGRIVLLIFVRSLHGATQRSQQILLVHAFVVQNPFLAFQKFRRIHDDSHHRQTEPSNKAPIEGSKSFATKRFSRLLLNLHEPWNRPRPEGAAAHETVKRKSDAQAGDSVHDRYRIKAFSDNVEGEGKTISFFSIGIGNTRVFDTVKRRHPNTAAAKTLSQNESDAENCVREVSEIESQITSISHDVEFELSQEDTEVNGSVGVGHLDSEQGQEFSIKNSGSQIGFAAIVTDDVSEKSVAAESHTVGYRSRFPVQDDKAMNAVETLAAEDENVNGMMDATKEITGFQSNAEEANSIPTYDLSDISAINNSESAKKLDNGNTVQSDISSAIYATEYDKNNDTADLSGVNHAFSASRSFDVKPVTAYVHAKSVSKNVRLFGADIDVAIGVTNDTDTGIDFVVKNFELGLPAGNVIFETTQETDAHTAASDVGRHDLHGGDVRKEESKEELRGIFLTKSDDDHANDNGEFQVAKTLEVQEDSVKVEESGAFTEVSALEKDDDCSMVVNDYVDKSAPETSADLTHDGDAFSEVLSDDPSTWTNVAGARGGVVTDEAAVSEALYDKNEVDNATDIASVGVDASAGDSSPNIITDDVANNSLEILAKKASSTLPDVSDTRKIVDTAKPPIDKTLHNRDENDITREVSTEKYLVNSTEAFVDATNDSNHNADGISTEARLLDVPKTFSGSLDTVLGADVDAKKNDHGAVLVEENALGALVSPGAAADAKVVSNLIDAIIDDIGSFIDANASDPVDGVEADTIVADNLIDAEKDDIESLVDDASMNENASDAAVLEVAEADAMSANTFKEEDGDTNLADAVSEDAVADVDADVLAESNLIDVEKDGIADLVDDASMNENASDAAVLEVAEADAMAANTFKEEDGDTNLADAVSEDAVADVDADVTAESNLIDLEKDATGIIEVSNDLAEAVETVNSDASNMLDPKEVAVTAGHSADSVSVTGVPEQMSPVGREKRISAHTPEPHELVSEAASTPVTPEDLDEDLAFDEVNPAELGTIKDEKSSSPTLDDSHVPKLEEDASTSDGRRDEYNVDTETPELLLEDTDIAAANTASSTDGFKGPTLSDIEEAFQLISPPGHYIPLKENQRLVCIGDVHGDFTALEKSLEIAGVYERVVDPYADDSSENIEGDPHIKWTGGDTILVQIGDVLDRGYEELASFYLLAELSRKAAAAGGHVIVLFGNHEVMNAIGLFHYAYNDMEYENLVGSVLDRDGRNSHINENKGIESTIGGEEVLFKVATSSTSPRLPPSSWRIPFGLRNQPARWATHEPGGVLAHPLMGNLKVAVQVGKTLCVHGGLTKEHLDQYGGIGGMNDDARRWILSQCDDVQELDEENMTKEPEGVLEDEDDQGISSPERQRLLYNSMPKCLGNDDGSLSPLWMRTYSHPPDIPPRNYDETRKQLEDCLFQVNCDRMVMGHSPQQEINAVVDGMAWRIDVGISEGVAGGTPEVLEVTMKDGVEQVSVLTQDGIRVPGHERMLQAMFDMVM